MKIQMPCDEIKNVKSFSKKTYNLGYMFFIKKY